MKIFRKRISSARLTQDDPFEILTLVPQDNACLFRPAAFDISFWETSFASSRYDGPPSVLCVSQGSHSKTSFTRFFWQFLIFENANGDTEIVTTELQLTMIIEYESDAASTGVLFECDTVECREKPELKRALGLILASPPFIDSNGNSSTSSSTKIRRF